jgi:glycine betaine/choline ABC-type transport system substrate-binding protein
MKRMLLSLIILTLALTGCGLGAGGDGDTITVSGKPWTEQYILTHVVGELLKAKTDLNIDIQDGLGETDVLHQGMFDGNIDVFVDYTGTGLLVILKDELRPDDTPESVFNRVKEQYTEKHNITWMEPLGFNNTYALAMRKAQADELGIENASDIANHPDRLTLGAPGSFYEREDGFDNMVKAYDIKFKDSLDMNESLMYTAVRDGEVDVITAYSTDGRIPRYDLKVLKDDKNFFPPYFAVPLVRNEVLEAHPEVGEVLRLLGGILTDEKMQELNSRVDIDAEDPKTVAREFLQEAGLID